MLLIIAPVISNSVSTRTLALIGFDGAWLMPET